MAENQKTTTRPPIVVVLGHIDHGKTSLLLAIRNLEFTAEKPGGEITQHIGAYQITKDGKKITFLDTPGHEAFSQMRSRGAKVADIAVLVIDAAQGVQSQTKEAIAGIKQAGIQVIVVLNKIDKQEANAEKVKRELQKEGLLVESLGGKIPSLEISAKTKKGIPELLELILLVSELEELKADFEKPAEGVVIESYLDNLRGLTATLLLTDGCLAIGDVIGTSSAFAKIKNIENFQKISIQKALPSDPVIIFGFNQVPKVGEEFRVFQSSQAAENYIAQEQKQGSLKESPIALPAGQVLNLILKTDVLGSAEAIEGILKSLPQEKVALKILKSEAGNINESDVKLAKGGRAQILGFRVKINPVARKLAERERIRIRRFEVIYELVEEMKNLMEKLIEPEVVRIDLGKVKVLVKFLAEKNRQIVGGRVMEGEVKKGALIEVFRIVESSPHLPSNLRSANEEKVGEGKMINLQRNKKDIDLVQRGDECGILFEGNVQILEGDILLFYTGARKKGEL